MTTRPVPERDRLPRLPRPQRATVPGRRWRNDFRRTVPTRVGDAGNVVCGEETERW